MSEPSHIPVLHAVNEFLSDQDDGALQFTLTRENGVLTLSTFYPTGDGSYLPIEGDPPIGKVEVGATLQMVGRRIYREASLLEQVTSPSEENHAE